MKKKSFYWIYLSKLRENILKYYESFKEVPISFNHGLQITSESPASLSGGLPCLN